jgi:hypothetical protein
MLFHPERFLHIHSAVRAVVDHIQSRGPAVWMTQLNDLAQWWDRRSRWSWKRVGDGRVNLEIPEEATVMLKGSSGETTSSDRLPEEEMIWKNYRALSSAESYPAWTIGLSKRSPRELQDFLHNEGFLVESTDQPEKHALYLDKAEFSHSDTRKVLDEIDSCEEPLLRLWRWPNRCQSAFCISADICAIDLRDFWDRTRNF